MIWSQLDHRESSTLTESLSGSAIMRLDRSPAVAEKRADLVFLLPMYHALKARRVPIRLLRCVVNFAAHPQESRPTQGVHGVLRRRRFFLMSPGLCTVSAMWYTQNVHVGLRQRKALSCSILHSGRLFQHGIPGPLPSPPEFGGLLRCHHGFSGEYRYLGRHEKNLQTRLAKLPDTSASQFQLRCYRP